MSPLTENTICWFNESVTVNNNRPFGFTVTQPSCVSMVRVHAYILVCIFASLYFYNCKHHTPGCMKSICAFVCVCVCAGVYVSVCVCVCVGRQSISVTCKC